MSSSSGQPSSCPTCGAPMVFTPDGRARICERCGHRRPVDRRRQSVAELARAQRLLGRKVPESEQARNRHQARTLLQQGKAAVQAGQRDEAFHYLAWVLRTAATSKQRAEAWTWLSRAVETESEQRECLEQALSLDPSHGPARRALAVLDGRLRAEEIVDPNSVVAAQPAEPIPAQADQMICPRCAGRLNYTPDGHVLRCDFCGYQQDLVPEAAGDGTAAGDVLEQDFVVGLARASGHLSPVASRTLACEGCGVTFVLAPETLSLTCPYCDAVYVTATAETRHVMPPHALVPFSLSLDQAALAVRRWLGGHDIAPDHLSPVTGVYLPVWTFDVNGEIRWRGMERRGDRWVPVSGSHHVLLDDQLVPAHGHAGPHLQRTLETFDLGRLEAYDARFLADWPAERYRLPLADASLRARRDILQALRRRPHELTGGRDVRDLAFDAAGLHVFSYKLILLPLLMARFRLQGEQYDLFIDGVDGQVRGDRPRSVAGRLLAWIRGE